MDKLAQSRSMRSKLWENVNLTGKALEGLHSELNEVMNEMRTVDENIRNIAEDVKPWIRHAKSSTRQRDYLSAALGVTEFHKRVRQVSHLLSKFTKNVNIKHHQYLLDNFDGSSKDHLFSYNPNEEIKEACDAFDALIKEAGAYDWAKDNFLNLYDVVTDTGSNIVTNKGRARRLMEKRFSASFIRELKNRTISIVKESEKMLRKLLSTFSMLETGVSRRNVGLYVQKAEDFVRDFNSYHKLYVDYNETALAPLKEYQAEIAKKQEAEKAKLTELNLQKEEQRKIEEEKKFQQEKEQEYQQIQDARKSPFVTPHEEVYEESSFDEAEDEASAPTEVEKTDVLNKLKNEKGEEEFPFIDEVFTGEPAKKKEEPVRIKPKGPLKLQVPDELEENSKAAHQRFMSQLEVYANNDDINSFVVGILDYSEKLEETDPVASKDLLTIAQKAIDNYKAAGIFDNLFKGKKQPAPVEETLKKSPEQQELQRLNRPKVNKPQELIDEEENLYRPKQIDLPDGKIDQAYSDISFLSNITPDKIRITHETANYLKSIFANRIMNVLKISDFNSYLDSFNKKLIPVIKNAIYNGWVIASASVQDDFNPRDKYIEVYTRVNLSDIEPTLKGTAKITISARISANNGTLTVRNVKKHFAIDGVKSTQVLPKRVVDESPATPRMVEQQQEEVSPATRRSPESIEEQQLEQEDNGDEYYNE